MNINARGILKDHTGNAVRLIQITLFREGKEVARTFSDEAGSWSTEVPKGTPLTVLFDTGPTLVNAREWQPLVVNQVSANNDFELSVAILRSGADASQTSFLETLMAYQFIALIYRDPDPEYCLNAAATLDMLKFTTSVLRDIQHTLLKFFRDASHPK